MSYELLVAFASFALVASITPGPNNLMLMASGTNFGYARTIPHMLGVSFGFTAMVLMIGLGLSQVFTAFPCSTSRSRSRRLRRIRSKDGRTPSR
jgi:threonine/homoserine/homoserine lactone efflux protein